VCINIHYYPALIYFQALSTANKEEEVIPVHLSLNGNTTLSNTSTGDNYVDIAVSKDELQDSYEEFEKVFEANMRDRTAATLHTSQSAREPVTSRSAREPVTSSDQSTSLVARSADENHDVIHCGPHRIDVTRYRRNYIVTDDKNKTRSAAPRRNVSIRRYLTLLVVSECKLVSWSGIVI